MSTMSRCSCVGKAPACSSASAVGMTCSSTQRRTVRTMSAPTAPSPAMISRASLVAAIADILSMRVAGAG